MRHPRQEGGTIARAAAGSAAEQRPQGAGQKGEKAGSPPWPRRSHLQVLKAAEALIATPPKSEDEVKGLEQLIAMAYTEIDKAVVKGIMHENTAARKKARCARWKKQVRSTSHLCKHIGRVCMRQGCMLDRGLAHRKLLLAAPHRYSWWLASTSPRPTAQTSLASRNCRPKPPQHKEASCSGQEAGGRSVAEAVRSVGSRSPVASSYALDTARD